MTDIHIKKLNHTYAQIDCDSGIAQELSEHFTYFAPNYQFSPAYKYRGWNGKISEYNTRTRTIRAGLVHEILKFAKSRDYSISQDGSFGYTEFSVHEAKEFIQSLNLPFEPRDYQIKAFVTCVREGRNVSLAPTSSGKSLIIYLLCRYYEIVHRIRTLLIVPTIALVSQMSSDFKDYGYDDHTHQIMAGREHYSHKMITVSTYQSLTKHDSEYFNQYGMIVVDEVHGAEAKSIMGIMDKATEVAYRFGFTGTLTDTKTSTMSLTGMFGKIHQVTTTAKLMEDGHVSPLKIKILQLCYPQEVRKEQKKKSYQDEIKFLVSYPPRNKFIVNLTLSLKGNSLLLFRFAEHGKFLYESFKKKCEGTGRNVYFVNGGTDVEDREMIRKIIEQEDDCIIVGSKGTMSTGSNTKKLHNLIFVHPNKGKIVNLQSIGRSLRLASGKDEATLFDIGDDLSIGTHKNHTLGHLIERCKLYVTEKFKFKIYQIDLKS